METDLEQTEKCTWRQIWSELSDTLGHHHRANLWMHWYVGIEWAQRYTWRQWMRVLGDALGNNNRRRVKYKFGVVYQYRCVLGSGAVFMYGPIIVEMLSIMCENCCHEMRNRLGAGDSRAWDDAVHGVCWTWWYLIIIAQRDREAWHNIIFLGDTAVEHKQERNTMWEIIMRNWCNRECCVEVKSSCPIQ